MSDLPTDLRRLGRFAAALIGYAAENIGAREAMLAAGLILAGIGAAEIYAPAGLLLPGVALTAIAVFGTR